jgi:hypothetical protein
LGFQRELLEFDSIVGSHANKRKRASTNSGASKRVVNFQPAGRIGAEAVTAGWQTADYANGSVGRPTGDLPVALFRGTLVKPHFEKYSVFPNAHITLYS